ncbi:MAG: Fic family protein [Candidatus Dadabacteria bacterium]|nr:Fic family protein [Candidatus Dadabacteria bacterium]
MKSPLASIALFLAQLHHHFIFIHPFDDGNVECACC